MVTILSIVATLGLEVATSFINARAYDTTKEKMQVVDQAIHDFYWVHGRLPCPSNIVLPSLDSLGHNGQEECDFGSGGGDPTTDAWGIYAGGIPFRTLNIPPSLAVDSYGSQIAYYVPSALGSDYNAFSSNAGNLEIRTGKLNDDCSSDCSIIRTDAIYALVSSGADKRGAYNREGVAFAPCATGTDARIDAQNCALMSVIVAGAPGAAPSLSATIPQNVLYDSRYNNGTVSENYFDDIVIWHTKGDL